jgi:hypothetical protein
MHLNLIGLDRWTETSLVSKGASSNAKILGRTKQRLGTEHYERLAASGISPEAMILIANTTEPRSPKKMDKEMIEMVNQLAELKAGQKFHDLTLTAKDGEITALKASVETLTAENAKLKDGAELKAAQTELATATAKVTELEASKTTAETELADLKAKLTTAETQIEVLKAGAGNGGRSNTGTGNGEGKNAAHAAPSAFKARPR